VSGVQPGDWVRTVRYRHHGKVLAVYPDCPENWLWQQTQNLSEQEMAGQWALIWTPAANTVVAPVSDCLPAEPLTVDDLPDTIVVEAFTNTDEENAVIAGALDTLPGGETHVAVSLHPPDHSETALRQLTEMLQEINPTTEGEADE